LQAIGFRSGEGIKFQRFIYCILGSKFKNHVAKILKMKKKKNYGKQESSAFNQLFEEEKIASMRIQ